MAPPNLPMSYSLTPQTPAVDIKPNGSLSLNRTIDFQQRFPERGGAWPHSAVVFDLTDPAHPYYY
jgi:hypothetical protein